MKKTGRVACLSGFVPGASPSMCAANLKAWFGLDFFDKATVSQSADFARLGVPRFEPFPKLQLREKVLHHFGDFSLGAKSET